MIKTFEGIFTRFGRKQAAGINPFSLDLNLSAALMDRADREQIPAEELCQYLLRSGLAKRNAAEETGNAGKPYLAANRISLHTFACNILTGRSR